MSDHAIKNLKNLAEYQKFIQKHELTVVDFYANWCGVCKEISPAFLELSKKYPQVAFAKVNVEHNEETAKFADVIPIPTFLYFKSGKQVRDFHGKNPKELEDGLIAFFS